MTEPQQSFKEPPKGVKVIGLEPEPPQSFKEIPEGAVLEPPKSFKEVPEGIKLEDDLSIDEIKKMQSEGVKLSEKLQRKLFDADDERSLLDKASGVAGKVFPALVETGVDLISGGLQLANKAALQPLLLSVGDTRENSEKAQKVFKERDEAIRSAIIGGSRDIEETANAAVRAIYFGTGTTDKLLGKSKEERFRRWQDRQVMRDQEAQSVAENPDRTNYLLSQNPLIQAYVENEAEKMGLPPEEVEKVKQDYIQSMLDSGLTKEQINEDIATFGEFRSPVSIPGVGFAGKIARRVTGKALSKVTAPIANKIGNLPARAIGAVAGGTEFAANKVLEGTEFTQTVAKNIGQYAINDPDTWIKGTVNTAILPVVAVAKPVAGIARVVKDIARQVDVGGTAGRKGILERTGDDALSGKGAKGAFGPESKGGVARAKIGDWAIRQSAALVQPGINSAALNVVMGLPDIETAEDLGSVIGTGLGVGAIGGSRIEERLTGLIDPRTTMAQKITNLVTPDPAAYRRDEDADIKRFMAQASPEIQKNIADLSNIETRKTAIDATIANLEKKRDSQINPDDAAFDQIQIDGFLKQKEALSKATPETQAEATRQTALAFIDAYDLAQSTGGVAGLRGVNIAVLDPANADQFFRNLYGDSLKQAETTVNLLTGIPSLTETDSTKLTEARQLLQRFQTDVEGAKSVRGFAIQEDNTDPNSNNFVPPHLRRINQQGATAVINADLIKHMTSQGLNLRHTLQHEVQHAVQQFSEVQKMLSPLRGQLFDQKIKNDDGTTEVYQHGIYSDEDLDRYATRYAKLMSPSDDGASFYAQFGGEVEKMRAYIKDEILAETAAATGEYAGGTRAALDDVGRNVMDWLEVKTKSGRLKQLKEALRRNGVIFDNVGATSSVLNAQMSPETLAMMRQYQRGLKDFDGTMTVQQSRESDEPDIPLTKILGSVALQNKYRHADFFEKEQIIKATAPDGSVTEIVVPAGAKIDPFIDVYRTQGGQLVDADGNVVTLGPEITFGSMPDGTKFETDTRIARKSNGSPMILTNREMKARARKRTEIIQTAIDSAKDDGSGVRLSDTGNGNYRGVMSPAQIEAFMLLPNEVVSPNLKRMTKFFNTLMAKNDGTRVVMEYQAALLNGKYKALSPKIRDEVPIGFQLTKDGNFALTTISVSRLYDKMQAWADKRPSNLQPWNGDTGAFWDSVTKYLDNHAKGEKGETGLHPDAYIAGKMKNKINDLFNAYNAETKQANPDRSTLPRARGKDNLDIVIRSRRLDRINNFEESPSQKLPINYGYLTTNYMPEVNPMAAPMTAEEVQNRFDGSVTATRVRRAMETGEVDALESELRQMDDLLPTESLQLVQGADQIPRIQVVSMFDPENVASLEPEEIVSDIDAETEAELAILDAQDGTVPPQDIAQVLSSKLDQLYADGGRSPIIPALESELEKINQQLALQAQEQAAETMQAEEATQVAEEVAPVTQFMPAEAPSGERGFQSKLQMEIQRNFRGARATPEQLKAVLGNPQNVKPEEVKWSGVINEIDRLAQENNGKVPVQELLDYLRYEGQIKFNEVTLRINNNIKNVADQYNIRVESEYGETAFYDEFDDPLEFDELPFALQDAIDNSKKQPKFSELVLPGGENYREVVLSMPIQEKNNAEQRAMDALDSAYETLKNKIGKEYWTNNEAESVAPEELKAFKNAVKKAEAIKKQNQEIANAPTYTSSHFPDIPNYIAHMRLNERTDAQGNQGLFIEEFQSDRHQAGREKGYKEDFIPLSKEEENRKDEIRNKIWELEDQGIDENNPTPEYQALDEEFVNLIIRDQGGRISSVPDAPFRKDWSIQLFKRALRDAVDADKKWIGWTTGIEQVKRYEEAMRQAVDEITWDTPKGYQKAFAAIKNGNTVLAGKINDDGSVYDSDTADANGKQLSEVLGKEVASKILAENSGTATGDDLTVGGEGMKGFYDQILPKEVGKYVAKMGGKVEKSEISAGKKYNFELFNPQGEPKSVFVLRDQITGKFLADSEKETFSSRAEDGELMSQRAAESIVEAFAKDTDTLIWRVNITPEMENVVRAGQMQFMPAVSEELDFEYSELAKNPDYNKRVLQEMVDRTAKKAGYDITKVYHGTIADIKIPMGELGVAAHISRSKKFAEDWVNIKYTKSEKDIKPPKVYEWYIKGEIFDPRNNKHLERIKEDFYKSIKSYSGSGVFKEEKQLINKSYWKYEDYDFFERDDVLKSIKDAGFDGYEDREGKLWQWGKNLAIFDPNNIKSADPVTYDDEGNVIPLSQRFQTASPDIRFMPAEQPTEYESISARIRPLEGISAPTKAVGAKALSLGEIEPPVRGKAMLPDMELGTTGLKSKKLNRVENIPNTRVIDKSIKTVNGSRYYNIVKDGEWYSIRISDHRQRSSQYSVTESLSRPRKSKEANVGMDMPHEINVVIDEPVKNESEASEIINKVLSNLPKNSIYRTEGNGKKIYGNDTIEVNGKYDRWEVSYEDQDGISFDEIKLTPDISEKSIQSSDIITSAKPAPDAVIKPFSNALVSSAGLINFLPAWHGTPHEVDKFKLEKIGTGEGAQAWGWGLYFAAERKVSELYRKMIPGGMSYRGGLVWKDGSIQSQEFLNLLIGRFGMDDATHLYGHIRNNHSSDSLQQQIIRYKRKRKGNFTTLISQLETSIRYLKELETDGTLKEYGNLYKVDLDVKDEDLLDWDKPLSEQTESVRDAVTALINERIPKEIADVFLSNVEAKGGSLYTLISDSFGESAQGTPAKRASEALLAAGIPGIRYLDGGSRSEGQGTYNYVVFDENLITILDKNDKPVQGELPRATGLQFMPAERDQPTKKYAFAYTTSSDRIPLVAELVKAKNWQAIRDLNQATIRHAMSDLPNVKYTLKDLVGAFENEREISLMPEFEINNPEELAEVRKRMVSLGELWQQTEVLEEQVGGGDQNLLGTVDADGYLHIGKYVLTFDKLTPALVEKARQASGIQAMSYDNNSVIFYDTDNNPAEFDRRVTGFGTFITSNGRILENMSTTSSRVRSYRDSRSPKEGSLYYNEDPIRLFGEGQLPDRLRSPVYRVVSELLGRVLPPPKDGRASYFVKEDVTPKQVKLQNAIANKQAAVVLNDKKNKDVVKAYEELNAELLKQFDALVASGMTFTAAPDYDAYSSLYPDSASVIRDIRNNNNLVYLKTTPETFGPVKNGKRMDFSFHPILKDSGRTDASGNKMSYNDILRAVHDAIAHGIYSAQFGPVGEESAWNTHIRTIDNPWARWALTMETRAQNSWVNYQDKFLTEKKTGEDRMPLKKGDKGFIPVPARDYAEQKFALIPLKYALTGDAKIDKPVKDLIEEIGEKRADGSPEKDPEWMPSKKEREKIYASIKQPQGTPKDLLKQASDVIGKLTRKDDAENVPVIVEKAWVEKKSKDEDAEDATDDSVEDGEVITTSTAVLKDVVVYSLRGTPIVVRPLPNLFAENVKTKVSKNVLAIAEDKKKYLEYSNRVLTAADKLRQDPERFTTVSGYLQFMRESGASGNLLMPPSQIAQLVKDPNAILQLWQGGYHGKKTAQGTVAAAIAGLDSVNEMRDLFIQDGVNLGPTRMITGLHHMWGILSRQLDPYNQEALWMRMVSYRPVMEQLQLSINGQFALTKGEWQMVVQDARRATKGNYQKAGNNATANANAFHLMLTKHNGKWGELANIYKASDPLVMTNAFWGLGVGATGIKNKVQRFIGLTFGIHGSVLDRWRFVSLNLPMAMKLTGKATPELYFNYYGRNKTIPEDPVGIYKSYGTVENGNPVFSTALYAGIDKTIQGVIDNSKELRDFLGVHATPGGFHWVDWNCVKNEAVGHSSLDLTKEFLKRKGRNGTVDDFMDVVRTSTTFTRADQDGRIIDLVMKDGIFQVVEQK